MNKLLLGSSLTTFTLMFRHMYRYYNLKNMVHLVKTAIQIDTSYESINESLKGKKILLATSISIDKEKTEKSEFDCLPLSEGFNEEIDFLPIKINPKNKNLSLEEGKIKINWGYKKCYFFDAPILKSELIKNKEEIQLDKYKKLSYREKSKIFPLTKHEKIIKVQKGFINGQRLVVYGQIDVLNNQVSITPEFFIGSGIVEFEDRVEDILNKINYRLFDLLIFLVLLTVLHFSYKSFFRK